MNVLGRTSLVMIILFLSGIAGVLETDASPEAMNCALVVAIAVFVAVGGPFGLFGSEDK